MWSLLTSLLAKFALLKILLKSFGSLALLLPLALLLKAIGWPVLVVLLVLALPVILMLALFGLPLLGIALVGGALLSIVFWVLSVGLAVLKIVLPIVVIVWLVRWMMGWGSDKPDSGSAPTVEGGAGI